MCVQERETTLEHDNDNTGYFYRIDELTHTREFENSFFHFPLESRCDGAMVRRWHSPFYFTFIFIHLSLIFIPERADGC